ncbi:MAG: molybdate ABC transporter substrate-binding protein [Desulfitobacteriaceae bacterium]
MKKIWLWGICFLLTLSLIGCGKASNTVNISNDSTKNVTQVATKELMISAAASMTESLTEIQKDYAQKNPSIKLTLNFGGSGTLQKQIEQGAPADLFISAGKTQMDALEQKNLLLKESRVNLLGNDLVMIVGKDNKTITSVQDLTKSEVGKIGVCTPESAPAGKYAKESLTNLKLWDTLESKIVFAKDVTQVLNYVETGNVDAGFLYQSDAQGSTKVKVVAVVPASSHSPIVYPAAVIADTKNKQEAEDFLKYLQSSETQQIFVKYGFQTLKNN